MPYVKTSVRQTLDKYLQPIPFLDPGELNYVLTKTIHNYLKVKGLRYQTLDEIVGALECCKMEFVRRVVNPYEDQKIEENGDL